MRRTLARLLRRAANRLHREPVVISNVVHLDSNAIARGFKKRPPDADG